MRVVEVIGGASLSRTDDLYDFRASSLGDLSLVYIITLDLYSLSYSLRRFCFPVLTKAAEFPVYYYLK